MEGLKTKWHQIPQWNPWDLEDNGKVASDLAGKYFQPRILYLAELSCE